MTLFGLKLGDVANAAMILQTVIVVITAVVAVGQLQSANHMRRLAALVDIFEDVYLLEEYARRERILFPSLDSMPSNIDRTVTIDMFERVGFLVRKKYIGRRLVYDMYGKLVADLWIRLEDFVKKERIRLDALAYARDFEWLAKYCSKRRKRRMWVRVNTKKLRTYMSERVAKRE